MTGIGTALARRADQLLRDGKWHDYEEVLAELMKVVPPGRAVRVAELNRRQAHRGLGPNDPLPPRRRPQPPEKVVEFGAKEVVRDFLRNRAYETDPNTSLDKSKRRRIRQVGVHRALVGDPYRMQRDSLEYDNQLLREQLELEQEKVTALSKFVAKKGYDAEAVLRQAIVR